MQSLHRTYVYIYIWYIKQRVGRYECEHTVVQCGCGTTMPSVYIIYRINSWVWLLCIHCCSDIYSKPRHWNVKNKCSFINICLCWFFLGSVVNSMFAFTVRLGSWTKTTWLGLGRDQFWLKIPSFGWWEQQWMVCEKHPVDHHKHSSEISQKHHHIQTIWTHQWWSLWLLGWFSADRWIH